MRTLPNPLRGASLPQLPVVTLGFLVHLPVEGEYHWYRDEVVELSFRSMLKGISPTLLPNCEVVIYLNGCDEARGNRFLSKAYTALRAANLLDRTGMVVRQNVGGGQAQKELLTMARGKYIAYSDDDVLFYPGWLEESMKVLAAYPEAALVTGSVARTSFRWATTSTERFAKRIEAQGLGTVERGRLIPDEWEMDFCSSIGRDWEFHKEYTKDDVEFRMTYNGVMAWGTGHHVQFVGHPGRILPYRDTPPIYMPTSRGFDEGIDFAGWLRLATAQRMARHIGNVIDESVERDARMIGLPVERESLETTLP